jgi:aerobic carbon-monoxide dehydrogenase medium subunit
MTQSAFEYFRPSSVAEALELLARYGAEAKVLAGGQSLMPLINMRLARPAVLIDINRIPELSLISEDGDALRIGAATRHVSIERSPSVQHNNALLTRATALIGYPSIRSRATFGGSMAHADPAAEYPSVAVALGAELRLKSQRGERTVKASAFFKGLLTTDLADDELLVEVRMPNLQRNVGWAYEELATRPGDYATVGIIALLGLDSAGDCAQASLTCTAVGPQPIAARRAAASLLGQTPSPSVFDTAASIAAEEVEPESDALTSASYKRQMTRVLTRRALEVALGRATTASASASAA